MKSWKKLLAVGAACSSLFFAHAEAAYMLSDEVANPPAALQMATQIGVLKYENPALSSYMDKDAIVVLSFGTTFKDQRAKSIDATAQAIQAAHPNTKVVTAFTSHIVIKHIIENEGKCDYMTPEETLAQLKKEGYTRVALVSLSVIPAIEYKYDVALFHEYKTQFKKMTLGTPLMYWQGQEDQPDDVMEVMQSLHLPAYKKGTAILLMAHGTPDPSNAYYSVMQNKLREMRRNDVHVYTVEGWPRLEDFAGKLKMHKVEKIILMPLMMVAGDHANNDMAGDEEDSHKKILEGMGFKVETKLQGLGENKRIRNIFVERANEAWDALVK
ncbi:MAG: sirohydrochlorin cobaltochelatase [Quinella sp. 3Q1]|nr:sirohydrochlorin cobaltochelatase [Quinella sp. 3Q1]MBR3051475.1 sirohydrochlorin cobaltochelatase [Selenomonadaceae bacterium]MBR6889282.1 sirohydrochlorin cobaltochelatase [Selenomonadaceae bacterium]